jgi:hypothetical protein
MGILLIWSPRILKISWGSLLPLDKVENWSRLRECFVWPMAAGLERLLRRYKEIAQAMWQNLPQEHQWLRRWEWAQACGGEQHEMPAYVGDGRGLGSAGV